MNSWFWFFDVVHNQIIKCIFFLFHALIPGITVTKPQRRIRPQENLIKSSPEVSHNDVKTFMKSHLYFLVCATLHEIGWVPITKLLSESHCFSNWIEIVTKIAHFHKKIPQLFKIVLGNYREIVLKLSPKLFSNLSSEGSLNQ